MGERPGALLARRTRTVKLCSFDARSTGQPGPLPLKKGYKESEGLSLRPAWEKARLGAPGWAGETSGLFEHSAENLLWHAKLVKREMSESGNERRFTRYASRLTVRDKENRHDTHYSHQSFPMSLGGTWC